MTAARPRVQHLPFFEALAGLEESSSEWRATSAGLVTLRLVDDWMRYGMEVVKSGSPALRAVREVISAMESRSSTRTILTSIVDSMQTATTVQPSRVLPRMLAYARSLQFDAQWALAIDVYRTVGMYADPVREADIVIAANMQMGSCYRTIGDVRAAATAFRAAGELAAATNDMVNVLRSRIQEAKLAIDRGNLPRAEVILDDVITQAEQHRLEDIHGMALHDRAVVAYQRKDFVTAAQFAFRALQDTRDSAARDRVLGDIAACFTELGLRGAARDAYLLVAATAQEQYVRWTAMMALMEIAALDGREPLFERYRRELAGESLPPNLAAYYQFYIGVGLHQFGRLEQARIALQRAVAISAEHQLNQLTIEAEQRLSDVGQGPRRHAPVQPPAREEQEVAPITSAIRQMRELAGVGE